MARPMARAWAYAAWSAGRSASGGGGDAAVDVAQRAAGEAVVVWVNWVGGQARRPAHTRRHGL